MGFSHVCYLSYPEGKRKTLHLIKMLYDACLYWNLLAVTTIAATKFFFIPLLVDPVLARGTVV